MIWAVQMRGHSCAICQQSRQDQSARSRILPTGHRMSMSLVLKTKHMLRRLLTR